MSALAQYLSYPWPVTRQWSRALLRSAITVTYKGVQYRGWCADVSEGGVGFTCAVPVRPGDEIALSVACEEIGYLDARAVVRHSSAFRVGCEFLFVSSAEQQLLQRFVRKSNSNPYV
jgi:PilZ domain